MRVLVMDTALDACTVAMFEDDRCLSARSEPMGKGHQERIGGLVRDVVAEAGADFEALDRIGVTVGPGSFTGLRVGLAFAQGLGAALGLPVVGISTLAALARSKQDTLIDAGSGFIGVAAVIDARRGQVYIQTFLDGVPAAPAQALAVDVACENLAREGVWSLVGSGAPLIVESLSHHRPGSGSENLEPIPEAVRAALIVAPTAEALAALTIAADPAESPPRPLYLRAPDATPPTRLPGQPRTSANTAPMPASRP